MAHLHTCGFAGLGGAAFSAMVLAGAAASLPGCAALLSTVAGASTRDPERLAADASPEARRVLDRAFDGIDPAERVDHHCHLVGLGAGGTGCFVNARMLSWSRPVHRLKFLVYRHAGGIRDDAQADAQYLDRLVRLARAAGGRYLGFAFDEHIDAAGRSVAEKTEFHVPDAYSIDVARRHPDLFVPVASVHPYRADAVERLERARAAGVRVVKWLPNAMGIDPADPRCIPFLDAAARLGITIVSHSGCEKAVHAEEDQKLGNPLRMRAALERGVRVVLAHCASLGDDEDLDAPGRPKVPSIDLFLRMMDEPRWNGLLFGDLSAVAQSNRARALPKLLARSDLHDRFIDGSDYPLPAINVVFRLATLVEVGVLDPRDMPPLREIYDHNPILFDFALKRSLRLRRKDGSETRFPARCFTAHPSIPL
ncbi:MAG: hypothetical protein HMLKMBBP_02646 [Planctomycetes bacterium]|nr:hypothetical protein [Planctomycetota bacterium]